MKKFVKRKNKIKETNTKTKGWEKGKIKNKSWVGHVVIHGKEKWFMWGKKVRGWKIIMGDTWKLLQVILKIVLKKLFFIYNDLFSIIIHFLYRK